MAIKISSSTVISDARALNNITAADDTTATSIVRIFDLNSSITAGGTAKAKIVYTYNRSATSWDTYNRYTIMQKGTVRFAITAKGASNTYQGQIRVLRTRAGSSSAVYTQDVTTTSTTYTTDQSVQYGDAFDIQLYGASSGSGKSLQTYITTITTTELRAASADVYFPGWDTTDSVYML